MSEIMRVAPWSLRALGYSFGIAERAVRFLAWAEAVHGQMLRTLRTQEQDITRSTSLPPAGRTRNGQRAWDIDAGGKYLLEVGPPAIDLLTCDVRTRGAGHIVLANACGAGLLAALCDLAARRRIGCIAIYRAGDSDDLSYDVARLGWLAALPSKRTLFLRGTAKPDAALILSLVRPWCAPVDGIDEAAIRKDVGRVLEGLQVAYIGLSGFQPNPTVIEAHAALGPHALAGLHALDYADRVAAAYRSGIEVDLVDLVHLYELEKRTWAPTSDRSRAQAGYGQY
jgi:hypothetical protein